MSVAVFLGPSLPVELARQHLDALYLPPVGQGEVYRLVRDLQPDAIAIIDGFFHQQPSVWHKEILFALSRGVTVFGGGSMGALRAAELSAFGMQGAGAIFEAYRDGLFPPYGDPFDGDDEVAVLHGPEELGWPALCEPLVDLRHLCAEAADRGVMAPGTRDALVAALKRLPFEERSTERLLAEGRRAGLPGAELAALEAFVAEPRPGRKALDAVAVLQAVAAWQAAGAPGHEPDFHFEETTAWLAFVEAEDARTTWDDERVLDELRFGGDAWDAVRRQGALRAAARSGWGDAGLAEDVVREAFEAWRSRMGLSSAGRTRVLVEASGLTEPALARLFDQEARLAARESLPQLRRAILDEIRIAGRYPALLERARAREARLARLGPAGPPPAALALLDQWLGGDGLRLRSVERERIRWAFDDAEALSTALWRHLRTQDAQPK